MDQEVSSKEDDDIYAIHITNEANNKDWLKQKLHKLWCSPKFCGICLNDTETLYSMEMEFLFGRQNSQKSIHDMLNYVFNADIENIMLSTEICEQCAEKTIQSYLFIHNTKQMSKIIQSCSNDILSKVDDVSDQLENTNNYENTNLMIILENDTEMLIDEVTSSITEVVPNNHRQKHDETSSDIPKSLLKYVIQEESRLERKEEPQIIEEVTVPSCEVVKQIPVRQKKVVKSGGTPNITLKEGKLLIKPLASRNSSLPPIFNTYKCSECPEIFVSYRVMKEHEKNKHKALVYQCKLCNKSYNTQQYLNVHYKTHAKARCKICRLILPEDDLINHLRTKHENVVHQCMFCSLVYYSPESLETHFKTTHLVNDSRSQLQCIMCLKSFKEEEIKKHKCKFYCPECTIMPCIHHRFLMSYREQTLNHASKIKCIDCDYTTKRKEYLISHANREHLGHHPFTCNDCKQQFYTKMSLRTHITQFHEDLCICEYCDNILKDKAILETHRKACKLMIRLFSCEQCVASFDTSEEYEKHLNLKHSQGIYPCKLCKREFLTPLKLSEHHARVHSGIQCKKRRKFIECTLCNINFKTIKEMIEHENSHEPDTMYPCKVCAKQYSGLRKLYIHKQRHYTERKRCEKCNKTVSASFYPQHAVSCAYKKNTSVHFSCSSCKKWFQSESSLKIHEKVHLKPIPCEECGKLVKPAYLKKHMEQAHRSDRPTTNKLLACHICGHLVRKIIDLDAHVNRYHLKVKPYICHICSKDFCGKARLKEHLATHTDDHACFCSVCGRKFANKVCLKMHFRLHTGENPYTCDLCGEKFRSSSIMKTHRLKKHLDKTVSCPLCDSMFYMVRDMRYHFKKVHWKFKDKPFNPREVKELDEKFYPLFEDGRLPKLVKDGE